MNAEQELQKAYDEWRRLAEAEGEAIRAGQWILVLECQEALKELQPLIVHYTDMARREWTRRGVDAATQEEAFRPVIRDLMDIELRNQGDLELQRQAAQAELGEVQESGRTLQRVRRSYLPAQPATWTSLS